MMFISDIH
ncbi:hypothetical protein E2320_007759, partial [Naja naja]